MLYALILAGGKGTRLYPLSRYKNPKQFLKIINNKSFLRTAVDRIKSLVDKENIYIVTNTEYIDKVYEELPDIDKDNIFAEPENKETPIFTLLASRVENLDRYGTFKFNLFHLAH